MSLNQYRKRLERLEAVIGKSSVPDSRPDFPIPLSVAMALRNDDLRRNELLQKQHCSGRDLVPSEIDELKRLEASIKKRAQAIQCPEGYGEKQALLESRYTYRRLERVRLGKKPTTSEDIEDALSNARLLVYAESPDGQARQSILQLKLRQFSHHRLDSAEEKQLNDLKIRYPDLPLDPNDPMSSCVEAWARARKEYENR
jgi:hypothetical protein